MTLFPHSLRYSLIAAFFGLALIPVLIVGGLLGWHTYTQHLNDSYARQQQLAQRMAVQLEAFLHHFELHLEDTAELTGFSHLDAAGRQRALALLLAKQPTLREVWYLDATGREQGRLSRVRLVTGEPPAASNGELFRNTVSRRENYFSPVYYAADSGEPLMDVGLPLVDPLSGKVAGLLAAQVRVKAIWALVAELQPHPGETVYILDSRQRVVAHRNPSVVLRETHVPQAPQQQRQSGLNGADAFIASAAVSSGGQEWTVVVELAASEALAPALRGIKIVAAVTLAALLVALLLCFYAIRRIVLPIQEVATAARAIRDGNLERRAAVDGDDEIGEMAGAFNDMTARLRDTLESLKEEVGERRRAQEQLRATSQLLDSIVENIPNMIFLKSTEELRFVLLNKAAEELLGIEREQMLGKNDYDFFPREQAEFFTRNDREVLDSQAIRDIPEERIETRQLGARLLHTKKLALRDESGRATHLLGISEDITERRQAERQLAENRKVLRTMIDTASMWISFFDRDGRYVVANRRYAETFRLPLERIEGAHYTEVLPPALAQGQQPYIERCLTGETVAFEDTSDVGAAEPIYTSGTYVPVFDENGQVIGGVVAVSDISAIKHTEQALRELNSALEQRVREQTEENLLKERLLLQQSRHAAMGEMVSAIAHQWRQPLNALAITLANLQDSFDFGELDKACLSKSMQTAHGLIQKMSATIDDFRDFFRTQRRKERYSVAHTIRDAAKLLQPSLAASEVELVLNLGEDRENFGSANELGQVLVNLIVNAKEAAIERRVEHPHIEVTLGMAGENAVISVEDNAGGIDASVGERIFDPYFTTKPLGTGIGLYMVKIIVERHMGGTIRYAVLEHGTRFTLTLPLREPSAEELRDE